MSKSPKHSPGPWKLEVDAGLNLKFLLDAKGNCIQASNVNDDHVSGNISDWHLQAAAPEMKEALEAWKEYDYQCSIAETLTVPLVDLRRIALQKTQSALAKANGIEG